MPGDLSRGFAQDRRVTNLPLAHERRCCEVTLLTEDRQEALKAFAEKRKPSSPANTYTPARMSDQTSTELARISARPGA